MTKDIRDYENDSISGKRTTVVEFGPTLCTKVAGFFVVLGLVAWLGMFFHYQIHWSVILPFIVIAVSSLTLFWILIGRLIHHYQKDTARLFHRGYIWSMTLLCLLIAVGFIITP